MSKEELMKEVIDILDEMAHAMSLKAVRGLSFFLIKVFKTLFKRVYVNDDGVQRVMIFLKLLFSNKITIAICGRYLW